ncbi:MAG: tandem-95 repeat protein [Pseudomonadota bacterium]
MVDKTSIDQRGEFEAIDPEDGAPIALEPRIAFDAAAAAEVAEEAASEAVDAPLPTEPPARSDEYVEEAAAGVDGAGSNQIVFIDAAVENPGALLDAVPTGAEAIFVDAGTDGLTQIADALAGREGLDAIHILSHGDAGELTLGATILTAETIASEHADELAAIGAALAETGDILIYGCDFGADAAALDALAAATGADVAASTDDTGAASLGGDWALEAEAGEVEAAAIDGAAWDGVLAQTSPAELNHADLNQNQDLTGVTGQTGVSGSVGPFGLNQGVTFDVNFELTGDAQFASGIQYREQFGIDFIRVQPRNTDFPAGDLATYEFDFSAPVFDLSFDFGGLDNQDQVRVTAFLGTTQVALDASMFSGFTGGVNINDTSGGAVQLIGPGSGQANPLLREFQFDIGPGVQVDRIVLETAKANGNSGTVTLGAYNFAWDVPPEPVADAATAVQGVPLVVDAANGVLANDDGAGETLTVTEFTVDGQTVAAGGAATIAGVGALTVNDDGSYTFTPDPDFVGDVPQIVYTTSDGNLTAQSTLDIEVLVDTDGDGVANVDDIDDDNDGILDVDEGFAEASDSKIDGALGVRTPATDPDTNGTVSFTIQSANLADDNNPHILESVTVNGERFEDFVTPDGVDVQFQNGANVYERKDGVDGRSSNTDDVLRLGDAGFEDNVLEAFQSSNLNHYLSVDGGANDPNAQVLLTYDTPIVSTAGLFLLATERNSNNGQLIEALDENGNVIGSIEAIENGRFETYIQTGAQIGFNQRAGISVFPVDDLAPVGAEIHALRITYPDGRNDGPDGKVFFFGDFTPEQSRDSDGDGVPDHLDIDVDNDGITDNVEAQATNAYIAPSGQGADMIDANGNGLDDNFEVAAGTPGFNADGIGLAPVDTDGDGTADYLDEDSDGDGIDDIAERGDGGPTATPALDDEDGDGLLDAFEGGDIDDGFDVNDENIAGDDGGADGGFASFNLGDQDDDVDDDGSNADPLFADFDWRDAEELLDDAATTEEDTPVTIDVLDNDDLAAAFDPANPVSGATLTLVDGGGNEVNALTVPGEGVYEIVDIGGVPQVRFTPEPNFTGPTTPVTYGVRTANGGFDTAELTVTVDEAPDPVDDAIATDEDTPVALNILDNDDVGDGVDTVTIDSIPPASQGVIQYTDGGGNTITVAAGDELTATEAATLTFVPAPDFNGVVAPIDYTVTDLDGDEGSATANITVEPEPEDDAITGTTPEDSPLTVNPLTGQEAGTIDNILIPSADLPDPATVGVFTYTDDNGNTVTLDPANPDETLSETEAATLTFTPAPNFNGTVPTITTTVTDTNGDTSTVTIDIEVTPVNDPPVADDESFTTLEDTPINIDVLDGDVDPDGDVLTITEVDGQPIAAGGTVPVANGTVTLENDGTLTFTPDMGYNGPVDFTYTIEDPSGASTSATVSGEVDPVPMASMLVADTPEDTPLLVDPTEGQDPADFAVIQNVRIDSVPLAAEGVLTYTEDGTGNIITVSPGDVLTRDEAQTLTYEPFENFNGPLANVFDFTLISDDGMGGTIDTPGTYELSVIPVNDPPVADDETFTVDEDGGPVVIDLIDGDDDLETPNDLFISEIDGQPVAPGDTVTVAGGSVTVNNDGTISYTPAPDFNGPAVFEYTVSDPQGGTDTGTVSGFVEPLPEGGDVPATTPEETPVAINPLANEDPGTVDFVTIGDAGLPDPATVGTFTYTDDGGNTVTLDPNDAVDEVLSPTEAASLTFNPVVDFTGTVPPVPFVVTDTNGDEAPGNLLLEVTPVNDPPVAQDATFETPEDAPLTIDIINTLTSDVDNALDELDITAIDGTPIAPGETVTIANGEVTLNFDGTVTFTPDADYFGPAEFDYTVTDPGGLSDTATISLTVDGLPEPVDDAYSVKEDGSVATPIQVNHDLGDGPATIALDSVPTAAQGELTFERGGATVTVDPANPPQDLTAVEAATLVFTPTPDFDGPVDNIEYTVTDADGDSASATATIDIDPAPDAVDDVFAATEDTPLALPLIGNDDVGDGLVSLTFVSAPPADEGVLTYTDAAGDTITVFAGATLTAFEAGNLTFTPADDFFGPVTQFAYTITDNTGDTSTANVDITVNGLPEPQPDVVTTDEDAPVDLNITANDDLGDGPATIALDAVPPATQGVLTFERGGATVTVDPANPPQDLTAAEAATLNFAPAADFDGPVDQIAYTVTDANGDQASTTVTITINPLPDPVADVFTTKEDTPLDLPLTANDDLGDGLAELTIITIPPAAQGALTYVDAGGTEITVAAGDALTPAEAATIKFTPADDFSGPVDQFTYQVEDANGDQATTTVDITVDATPDVSSDAIQAQENVPTLLNVFDNDQDFGDGIDVVVVEDVPPPAQGTLTYTEDGTGNTVTVAAGDELTEAEMATLTFNPAQDFNGTVDPFDYTVRDLNGDEATATVTIGVAASVDAEDESLETPEETPLAVNPLDNDDPGGPDAVVTVDAIPPATQGVYTYTDENGGVQPLDPAVAISTEEFATLVFTPAEGFQGQVDQVRYLIVDPDGNTDAAFIDILVDGIPEAEDDVFAGEEDTPLPVSIIANDDQGDGPAQVRFEDVPDAAEGVLTYTDANGVEQTVAAGDVISSVEASTLVFTPAADFNGAVAPFDYTLIDQDGDESTATVTIDIDANPDLAPDIFTTTEDTNLGLPIFDNDDLGDGLDTLTIDSIPNPAEGVLTFTDAGGVTQTVAAGDDLSPAEAATLTFEPAPDFFGPITRFEYTVTDADGDQDTTTVDITVDGIPELVPEQFSTDEDAPVAVNLVANDDLGDGPATIALDSVPPLTQGTLTFTDAGGVVQTVDPANPPAGLTPAEIGTLVFTPAPDFDGAVDPIEYTVTDADGDTDSSTAQIVINPLPDPIADAVTTDEDTPVAQPLVDNDDTGDGLATLTVDGLPAPAQGTLTFTDDNGVEQAVVAGDPLSPTEASTIVFTPAPDFSGPVPAIRYTITDTSGDSASAIVTVTVDAVPDPVDDVVETPEETPVAINVLADNGNGPDDPGDGVATVSFDVIPPASQGVLTYVDANGVTQPVIAGDQLTPDEAVTLVFTPDPAFNGVVDPVPYTITDTNGDTGTAAVNITVDGIPDVAPDIFVAGPNETIPTNFLTNDPDFGDGLDFVTIIDVPPASQGELVYTQDGGGLATVAGGDQLSETEMATLQFNPEDAFFGAVDPINYSVTDIDGDTAATVANIFVAANTDVEPDDLLTKEDTPLDLNLVDNDEIADAASTVTIGATIPDPVAEGTLTYIEDGTGNAIQIAANDELSMTELATITFTPAAGFTGAVTNFDYTVTASPAGGGASDTATVMILVDPAPEAVNDQFTTKEDTIVALPINGNDDNGTGFQSIQFTSLPNGATEGDVFFLPGGTGAPQVLTTADVLTEAEAASLFFVPVADFNGPVATFQYQLTDQPDRDGTSETVTADVEITVDAVPDPVNDLFLVNEDTPLDIDILGNDDTGDGLASVTILNLPGAAEGVLSFVDAGGNRVPVAAGDPLSPAEAATLRFTPAPDFDGVIPVLNYTIEDANGDRGAATITLLMNPTPDVAPDVFSTKEDTPVAVNPLTNDEADLGGDRDFALIEVTGPPAAQGELSFTRGGVPTPIGEGVTLSDLTPDEAETLVFTPAPDFSGVVDPIPYTVSDANGDTASTTISITVDAVPDAVDETFTVDEDKPLTLSVIDNDDQGDGPATVQFAAIPDPAQGVLTFVSDAGVVTPVDPAVPLSATEAASLTFTPAPNFDGSIPPLDYTVTDQNGDTDTATLTLQMNAIPDASNDVRTVKEDGFVDVLPLDNDPDQGDGPATIDLTAPPATQGVLSVETTPGDPGTRVDLPAGANTGLDPTVFATLRFTPTADFDGTIDPIPYTVIDDDGDTDAATIFIAVDPTPDPQPDTGQAEEDFPLDLNLTGNDDLGEGLATLRFDTFPDPAQGKLTVLNGGVRRDVVLGEELAPALIDTLQFEPFLDFNGIVDQFDYTITDSSGDQASTTVDLVVDPAPKPASDRSDPTDNGVAVEIDVVANDEDNPNGDIVNPATVQIFGTDNPGDPLVVDGEGEWTVDGVSGAITFTPEAGFVGDATPILYTIEDDEGFRSDPVGVRADYVPVADPDALTNQSPGPAEIDILDNDANGDAVDTTTVQLVGTANPGDPLVVPGQGTWSVDPITGALTFTPEDGFTDDPDPVQYTVEDAEGNRSDPAAVSLDYAPVGTADVSDPTAPGDPAVIDILANDLTGDEVDPTTVQLVGTANPGDPLVVPGEGTWTIDPATGALTFTPEDGFDDDPAPVQYTVADDEGNISAPVEAAADYVPVSADDVARGVIPGQPAVIDVLGNDVDGDTVDPTSVQLVGTANPGDPLVVPGEGIWTIDPATGAITFTPEPGFTTDPTPVQYTVADDEGNRSDPASVTADYAPVATPDEAVGGIPGQPATIDILANDTGGDPVDPTTVQLVGTDNPGDPLVVPGEGTWTIDPVTGALTFTPEPGFGDNPTPVQYTVADLQGNRSEPAGVTLTFNTAVNSQDILLTSGGNPFPVEFDREREDDRELSVEPIVRETADFQSPLGSITPLDVEFPITSAVNSLISLDGVSVLPTETVETFGGLAAPYPITIAVAGVDAGDFFATITGFGDTALDALRTHLPDDGGAISLNILIGFDRAIILLAAEDGEGAKVILAADGKDARPDLEVAAFDRNGDELAVRSEDGVAVIELGEGAEAAFFMEDGDGLALQGDVTIGEAATFALGEAQPYGGFSGQITEIANAKTNEIAALGGAL